jgi:hypothetical protein
MFLGSGLTALSKDSSFDFVISRGQLKEVEGGKKEVTTGRVYCDIWGLAESEESATSRAHQFLAIIKASHICVCFICKPINSKAHNSTPTTTSCISHFGLLPICCHQPRARNQTTRKSYGLEPVKIIQTSQS